MVQRAVLPFAARQQVSRLAADQDSLTPVWLQPGQLVLHFRLLAVLVVGALPLGRSLGHAGLPATVVLDTVGKNGLRAALVVAELPQDCFAEDFDLGDRPYAPRVEMPRKLFETALELARIIEHHDAV